MRELMSNVGEASTVARRLRVLRHRAMRWFQPPIRAVVRDRPSGVVRDIRSGDAN